MVVANVSTRYNRGNRYAGKVVVMHAHAAPISKDGEVTIPKVIRRRLGIGDEGSVVFIMRDDGSVELRKKMLSLEDVFGAIHARPGMSADFEAEIESAIEEHLAEKYKHLHR